RACSIAGRSQGRRSEPESTLCIETRRPAACRRVGTSWNMSESELIRKLVTKWHLSVPERATLPDRRAKASLICSVIADILRDRGWYPQDWRPEMQYDGGIIELQ